VQRNRAALLQESLKIAAILQVFPSNSTGEIARRIPQASFLALFSGGQTQSGFSDSVWGMQYDCKPMMRRKRFDFVSVRTDIWSWLRLLGSSFS
jgi:hypothetical protein